jgi:hypothetical protein
VTETAPVLSDPGTADGTGLWQHAVPFLADGVLVADPAQVRDVPVPAVGPSEGRLSR